MSFRVYVFTADTLRHAVTLTFDSLTLDDCGVSSVTASRDQTMDQTLHQTSAKCRHVDGSNHLR